MGDFKYKEDHILKGLCSCCNNLRVPGKIRCEKCLEVQRKCSKLLQIRRRKENKCPCCGSPLDSDSDNNYICCVNCRLNDSVMSMPKEEMAKKRKAAKSMKG